MKKLLLISLSTGLFCRGPLCAMESTGAASSATSTPTATPIIDEAPLSAKEQAFLRDYNGAITDEQRELVAQLQERLPLRWWHNKRIQFKNSKPEYTVNPQGTIRATTDGNDIVLFDIATDDHIRTLCGHATTVDGKTWNADGTILISYAGSIIHLWDVKTGTLLLTIPMFGHFIRCVALSADAKTLTIISHNFNVPTGDLSIAQCTVCHLSPHTKNCDLLGQEAQCFISGLNKADNYLLSQNGQTLSIYGCPNNIRLYNTGTGALIHELADTHLSNTHTFSPDGSLLACGIYDDLLLYDVTTGDLVRELRGHYFTVDKITFSHDGKTLASYDISNAICFWNIATGTCIQKIADPRDITLSSAPINDAHIVSIHFNDTDPALITCAQEEINYFTQLNIEQQLLLLKAAYVPEIRSPKQQAHLRALLQTLPAEAQMMIIVHMALCLPAIPKNTRGLDFAPLIYQKLMGAGIKALVASRFLLPVLRGTPSTENRAQDGFFSSQTRRMYVTPDTLFFQIIKDIFFNTYSNEKEMTFHELVHSVQCANSVQCVTINPDHYPRGVEQEADAQALLHITCPACVHECIFPNPLQKTLSMMGTLMFHEEAATTMARGYLSLAEKQTLIRKHPCTGPLCGYHKVLKNHFWYQLCDWLPYISAGATFLCSSATNPLAIVGATMRSLAGGWIASWIAKRIIERQTEKRVESGELEP